jgi:DNA modification methylase
MVTKGGFLMAKKDDKAQYIKISELKPYENNARTHSNEQIEAICNSIKEFGFINPVIIDENNMILVGHGRIEAAKVLGIDEAPYRRVTNLTEDQKRAYILADNKLSDLGGWDEDLLAQELGEIELDMSLFGFDNIDIGDFDINEEIEEDEVPEINEDAEPKAKLGDIYKLGNHFLMCGDSTNEKMITTLMQGKKADLVFTSPPYNGNNKLSDGDVFRNKTNKKLYGDGYEDNLSSEDYINFCKKVLNICFENTEGFIFWNVNYNANSRNEYIKQIYDKLDYLIEQIAWIKSSAIPLKGTMRRAWEPIYLFSTNKKSPNYKEVVTNKWEISNTGVQYENHKACFPVELAAKGINIIKPQTGIVLEPFGGSGSTLIACEQLGRSCYCMELDPKYIDVIIQRWENFTGKKAELVKEA